MRVFLALCAAALVAACGADGEPVQPTMNGMIGIGSDGAYGQVNVHNGPMTISIGRGGCYACW